MSAGRPRMPEPSRVGQALRLRLVSWKVVSGPREFRSTSRGHDMDIGWRYDVDKDGYGKSISVIVAGGRLGSPSLPEECLQAIRTKGRSAVNAVLERDHPPEIILVTTAGLREQPPPLEDQPNVGVTVTCGQCGRTLPERSDIPAENRPPCPQCGSTARTFLAEISSSITVTGSIQGTVERIAPPEPAQPTTADMIEAGYKVVWYCYSDGLYLVQVYDENTGELIDAGGGDDPVDALLEVAQRLLPPRPER
jgi:bacterioferritin-associated ferredoxin